MSKNIKKITAHIFLYILDLSMATNTTNFTCKHGEETQSCYNDAGTTFCHGKSINSITRYLI